MEESEEELKSFFIKVKEETEKAGRTLHIQKTKIVTSGPITSWQIDGETMEQWQTLLSWTPESLQMIRKAMTNLDSVLKCRDITLPAKVHRVSSSHRWMWELDHKEHWMPKNWYFWAVVLEKTLESLLNCKKIKLVNPTGNNPEYSLEELMAEADWPPNVRSWLIGKDHDTGKDWEQEKGMTENEMVGCYRRNNGQQFELTPGDTEEQGSLACFCPWDCKE